MQKYLAIINRQTLIVVTLCLIITWLCIRNNFGYNLSVTLFSIAVVFPLVFTIRESFRRRDNLIELLSIFKTSLNATYHCFADNKKMDAGKKQLVSEKLQAISVIFLESIKNQHYDPEPINAKLNEVFDFVYENRDEISGSLTAKIIRFLKDVHESMENAMGLKSHGTPVSLRAYCLVFIYMFPFVFTPTLVYEMQGEHNWVVYTLSALHGFILISLYNVQSQMEDPFDQAGLDDLQLGKFEFSKAPVFPEAVDPADLGSDKRETAF